MLRLMRTALCVLSVAGSFGVLRSASAADAPNAETQQRAARPVPPVVREAPLLRFPDEARAAGVRRGSVLLRVTVETDGRVSSAEVIEPGGYGFDAVAHSAALAHYFEPARRGGEPIRVRILLKLEFLAPEATASATLAASPGPSTPSLRARTSPRSAV